MNQSLSLTLVQTDLEWQNAAANLRLFDTILDSIEKTDLVILPEMFSTGFSMASGKLAEPMNGDSVKWLERVSSEKQIAICGSLIITDGGKFFNRFVLAQPDSDLVTYDKKHLFRMSTEDENYSAGVERIIFNINGFKICPQICYDLRFPAWTRNFDDYDVLLFVANWPAVRRTHWLSLLQARAIENQSWVVGVNRTGTDGNDVEYAGDSVAFDFNGHKMLDLEHKEQIGTVVFNISDLENYRGTFPAWRDRDHYQIR